jgi:ABC-type multidrug transport system fused ATPase/permease subunit
VIDSIDFSIKNMEKIGCIGRTGSGKSSLLLGLLRILELTESKNEELGSIFVDG